VHTIQWLASVKRAVYVNSQSQSQSQKGNDLRLAERNAFVQKKRFSVPPTRAIEWQPAVPDAMFVSPPFWA
jgi:hypothetical protein